MYTHYLCPIKQRSNNATLKHQKEKVMNIHAYIHDNKSTLISETKTLFDTLNENNFANAVVNNINEQSVEWNEPVTESDELIRDVAKKYYKQYIA